MGIWLYGFMGCWAKCWVSVRIGVEWVVKAGYPQDLYDYKSTCVTKNLHYSRQNQFFNFPKIKAPIFQHSVCLHQKHEHWYKSGLTHQQWTNISSVWQYLKSCLKSSILQKRVYLNCLALSETGLLFIEILHPRGPLLSPSPFSVPKTEAANSQPELMFA